MTTQIKIPDEPIYDIAQEWKDMTSGERAKKVRKIVSEYGSSTSTIYRRIKGFRECGRRTGKKRSDKGSPRSCSREEMREYVKIVMGFKAYDPTKPDEKIPNANKSMSTARAIRIGENLGLIPVGLLTPRTVNRWAKIFGITVKNICAPRPAVKIITEHPNDVVEVDFSVCNQYYLHEKNGKIMKRPFTYPNKPNEAKKKIWAFALVDHYSGVAFVKYFLSEGENAQIFYQGIMEALSKKDDTHFPFHGAPRIIYMDKGASWKSQKIKNLFDALGIEVITHKPGNPRAKGKVESLFRHIQNDFESELRWKSAQTIEELNDRVYNWMVEYNWKAKEGETKSRFNKWLEIEERLIELPPEHILARVTASHLIRTVDAYCNVSVNGETFGVPADVIGKKVRVWFNIDGGICVQDIETGKVHPTVDRKVAVFGEYNAYKKTDAERLQDDTIRMASELKKSGKVTQEVLRRDEPNLHGLATARKQIEVDSELAAEEEEEYRTLEQAKHAIKDELGINLGDLPRFMLDEIDKALMQTRNKEKVHQMAVFIGKFIKEEKIAV